MNKIIRHLPRISAIVMGLGLFIFFFISCEKAAPNPYSTPVIDKPVTTSTITTTHDTTINNPPDTTPSFEASVNNSAIISFTPSKNIVGSNTTLKGVSTYYTITITFPSSTGPGGPYFIGTGGITALLVNGSITYVAEGSYGGGFLTIDSISSKGKYYGTFNFDADDTTNITNIAQVSKGSFYHL
jgi:hypothetical protein